MVNNFNRIINLKNFSSLGFSDKLTNSIKESYIAFLDRKYNILDSGELYERKIPSYKYEILHCFMRYDGDDHIKKEILTIGAKSLDILDGGGDISLIYVKLNDNREVLIKYQDNLLRKYPLIDNKIFKVLYFG